MNKRILEQRGVSLALRVIFRFFDYIWPKNRNLMVFSGGRDVGYSDNSRYLFEKFIEVYSGYIEILWVTPNKEMLRDVGIEERMRNHMVYQYSPNGILSLLRAKTIFFCWGSYDLPGTDFSNRTITVQLWHGIPLKRMSVCQKGASRRQIDTAIRAYRKFTYWICSSKIERNSVALCTGLPIDDVKITGYPRNDYLIEHGDSPDSRLLERFPYLDRKIILYAPTWRSRSKVRFFPFDDFQIDELISFLEENDAYLILRAHHIDDIFAHNGTVDYDAFSGNRIVVLNRDLVRDVHDILPYVDILVSDYSGIWVDFLLLDRPMVFVPYDLDQYEANQGLLYDYVHITPGPKTMQFDEFLRVTGDYLSDPFRDSDKRNQMKKFFHEFDDGMAYKRIYQIVKEERSEVQ